MKTLPEEDGQNWSACFNPRMASCQIAWEKKPLKRPKLGPPDCYPQDAKQSEDELTADKVRQGYFYKAPLLNEYESARSAKFDECLEECFNKILQSHNAIASKKTELNALQDAGRKKAGYKEPSIWHLATKPKVHDQWFKDLAGCKQLSLLGKRFPFLNKKDEILNTLAELNVPMARAVWFLKMTNAHIAQQQESGKMKKKQMSDPYIDWANLVLKYLRDLTNKLSDYYSITGDSSPTADVETAYRHWQYSAKLCTYMFEEGLFDKETILSGLLDLFSDKACDTEIGLLKLIIPLILQLLSGFVSSAFLSRRLGYLACKVLASMYYTVDSSSSEIKKQWNMEHFRCPFHRTVILGLSSIVHALLIECPTALVWNEMKIDEPSDSSRAYLCGSPLDLLPCSPSDLPLLRDSCTEIMKKRLEAFENHVIQRSQVVESHWSFSKCERSGLGTLIENLLSILDCLDTFKFEYVDETNHIDSLYARIFPKDRKEDQDLMIVRFLCHWAVTEHRYGFHRSVIVTQLLQKRQSQCHRGSDSQQYPFQTALFQYVDKEAPNLGDKDSSANSRRFANLILLFSLLILADVFSHDLYISTLVSSGILKSSGCTAPPLESAIGCNPPAAATVGSQQQQAMDDSRQLEQSIDFNMMRDSEDSKLDLDKIIGLQQERRPATLQTEQNASGKTGSKPSKHYFNVLHFPLPQDEAYRHECNQRQLLIFGLSADRDCRRHLLKRITKELNKLWSKKVSIEFSATALPRVKKVLDWDTLCSLSRKISNLVYFDQHAVTDNGCDTCIEKLSDFVSGLTNCLPSVENIDFFLSLLEESCNFPSFIEFVEAVVALLPRIESQIQERRFQGAESVTLQYALCIVGYLRKHHCYLIHVESVMCNIWRSLFQHLKSKTVLSSFSAERCIWVYIHDLYECCTYIRANHADLYLNSRERIQQCLCSEAKPSICCDIKGLLADLQHDSTLIALFEAPSVIIEPNLIQRLMENSNFRFAFAVCAFKAVCRLDMDPEKLYQVVQFCTDVTALCPNLNADWIAVLRVLCFPTCMGHDKCHYEALLELDVNNTAIYGPLAVLVTSLLRRLCFRLEDFTLHVAFPALLPFWKHPESPKVEDALEASAKLTLFLLGKIFFFDVAGIMTSAQRAFSARTKGELYLMYSSADRMVPESILTLLISILMLDDFKESKVQSGGRDVLSTSKAFHDGSGVAEEQLSVMARELLEQMCRQEWIKRKFLQSTGLFDTKRLLNPLVNHTQAQRLLRMITRSDSEKPLMQKFETCSTKRELVVRILENLSIMNLWVSQTDFLLLLKQVQSLQNESLHLIDTIAKGCMEVFQPQVSYPSVDGAEGKANETLLFHMSFDDVPAFWLVAPLVARLPTFVQGRVLKAAASILENYQARRERNLFAQSSSLLGQQPFLALLNTCLRGQDDQREGLLCSLLKQVQEFVLRVKEDPYVLCDANVQTEMHDALQLRLGLVGGMFETVCRSNHVENWALLTVQLLFYGIVTEEGNRTLYYSCVDFLSILLQSCLLPESAGFSFSGQERSSEDCKRIYNNVIKKLKKELGDRYIPSMKHVYQLLPIPRQTIDVVVCDAYGSQPQKSSKSGSSSSLISFPVADIVQRKGLQIVGKEKLNPWEIVEGHNRENSGLRWAWFQAIKLDIQPETLVQQMKRMLPHDHHNALNRPPMPGELQTDPFLEALQVHYVPSSSDTSGVEAKLSTSKGVASSATGLPQDFSDQVQSTKASKTRAKKSTRGRKSSRSTAPVMTGPMVSARPMAVGQMPVPSYGYYPQHVAAGHAAPSMGSFGPGGEAQWHAGQAVTPMGPYQSRSFQTAPMHNVQSSTSKQAISAMIRGRHPGASKGKTIVMQPAAGAGHMGNQAPPTGPSYVNQPMGPEPAYNASMQQHMQMQMDQHMIQEGFIDQHGRSSMQRMMVVQQQPPPQSHNLPSHMAAGGPGSVQHSGFSNFPGNQTPVAHVAQPQRVGTYGHYTASPSYANPYYQPQNGGAAMRMVQPADVGIRYGQPTSYQMQGQPMRPPQQSSYAMQQQQQAAQQHPSAPQGPMYPGGQQAQQQAFQQQTQQAGMMMYNAHRLPQYAANVPSGEFNQAQSMNYYQPQY